MTRIPSAISRGISAPLACFKIQKRRINHHEKATCICSVRRVSSADRSARARFGPVHAGPWPFRECSARYLHYLRRPRGAVNGTFPQSINPAGAITGFYCDATGCHGFLRAPDGSFSTFDAPDDGCGTFPSGISPAGAITGSYYDANCVGHGFVRASDGTFTAFDAPDDVNGIFPLGINPQGTVSGCYVGADLPRGHGFVRDKDGALTTFDVPNSPGLTPFCSTQSLGINPAGAITGTYFQPIQGNPFGGNYRGFLRAPDGTFTTFDAATYPPCCIWTFALAINPAGAIAGYLNDGHNLTHGFLRASDGSVRTLDAPGSQGTIADGINPVGVITGYYTDASGLNHGFLWTP